MQAYTHYHYGGAEVLQRIELPTPVPTDNEVLINVKATSINDWDLGILQGTPYLMRLSYGWRKPKPPVQIMGCDVAGVVVAVGKHVSRFSIGDAVYGDLHACGFATFAEFTCASEDALEPKPDNITWEEAASLPHAATLAWQSLFDMMSMQAGQHLLINGAGGGVGPIAMQLAKLQGLSVSGVDRKNKLTALAALGFESLIDYETQNFTRLGVQYDAILDVKTTRSPFAFLPALTPGGAYVTIGGSSARLLQMMACKRFIKARHQRDFSLLILKANRGLAAISELISSGQLKPMVVSCFDFADLPKAMQAYIDGRETGRIVVSVGEKK